MAVNINGDTGIDKVQPGTIDSADFGPGVITAPAIASGAVTSAKLDTNLSIPGTMTATSFVGSGASLTGIAGGFSNMEVFTSPGTWTNPGNITKVKVTVTGGGGGGGTVGAPNAAIANGGAAGGTAIEVIPFPSGTNVAVTVGSGGAKGAPTNNSAAGSTGGTSSFGAYCSATGGGGAINGNTASIASIGGTGSGGTLNIDGGDGYLGGGFPAGGGGASYWGGGAPGRLRQANAPVQPAGRAYGSGGGGGFPSISPAYEATDGKAGVVVVEY